MDIDKVINNRFSCRKFLTKKPDFRDIILAIEAGSKGPLAGGLPSVKFILIDDDERIKEIADATQQDFVRDAHYVVVVVSDPTHIMKSYEDMAQIYMRQQAGAAIENFLLKLTDLGLGACWVGLFVEEQIKRTLSIPSNFQVEAIIPVGYPFGKGLRKAKPNLDRVIAFNKYGQKQLRPKKKIEAR